jgi:2-dehydropantoate 2-reductase
MRILNVLSIGAGAIGTYIGGSLALQGHSLTFIERPEVIPELKRRGLRITKAKTKNNSGEKCSTSVIQPNELNFLSSIKEALYTGKYDIALYALKSYDTPAFLSNLRNEIPDPKKFPTILCFSNGVGNEPALSSELGSEQVLAGTVTSAIGRRDIGDIVIEKERGIGVADTHPIASILIDALNQAGLNAQPFTHPQDMKWSKMLTNLISNANSAILDMSPNEVYSDPKLFDLEIRQLRETLDVMKAQGIRVVDLPGTPVRLLAFTVQSLPLLISRPILKKAIGGGRGGKMPSFHIDLHNGHGKSEVNYLNGAVVQAGLENNIPTPVNKVLTNTLLRLTSGKYKISDFAKHPERLLGLL